MLIPKTVVALVPIAHELKMKYATDCIALERGKDGKCFAVATDGRCLIFMEWNEPDGKHECPDIKGFDQKRKPGFSVIVPTKAIEDVAEAAVRDGPRPILGNIAVEEWTKGARVTLAATDGVTVRQIVVQEETRAFPKWRDVIPKYKPLPQKEHDETKSIKIGVDARLLSELLHAVDAVTEPEDNHEGVILEVPLAPNKPIVIRANCSDGGKVTAVIMPVKFIEAKVEATP